MFATRLALYGINDDVRSEVDENEPIAAADDNAANDNSSAAVQGEEGDGKKKDSKKKEPKKTK